MLIAADIGAPTAAKVVARLAKDRFDKDVSDLEIREALADVVAETLQPYEQPLDMTGGTPSVVVFVGVNGSGKTTSIAKLTKMCVDRGDSVVLGAGDTFRAAAVEQLTIWSERLGAEIVKGKPGGDPASVAHMAVARALEINADTCIIDTAGRLQTQANLMEELAKIRRVIQKQIADAPHEVLLVLDATAGQNGISQAKGFSDAVECTGIVLAKLDGTAKGGVVIPIRQQFEIPVKYIGVGEQPADLAVFSPPEFVDALFSVD